MAFEQRSLDDYVPVDQRIADFREKYPDGTLAPWNPAEPYRIVQVEGFDKDGKVLGMQTYIIYVAAAYRHPGDPNPGVGMAWEVFPGRTNFTRGSELQNAETSAWGRAIIAVGASDSKRGIASREEVRNRQAERAPDLCHGCAHPKDYHRGGAACMYGEGEEGCGCTLAWNADGSWSRSRTSDEQKAAAGVMTDAEQRAHNALERDTLGVDSQGKNLAADLKASLTRVRDERVDAAVDDRWTSDAPSWLVGVDPPEDQPGSVLPQQVKQIMAVYTALGIKDRNKRMTDLNTVLVKGYVQGAGPWVIDSTDDLSYQQAARLLENLHERHTGKMTRR